MFTFSTQASISGMTPEPKTRVLRSDIASSLSNPETHLLQLTGVSGEEISIKPEFRAVSALADLSLWCHSVCTNDLLVFRVPH
jgi:hypothetical protein